MPPSNLYLPVKFEGGEWVGTPYEEWKTTNWRTTQERRWNSQGPNNSWFITRITKTQEELRDVHKDISDLTIQLLGGTTNAWYRS